MSDLLPARRFETSFLNHGHTAEPPVNVLSPVPHACDETAPAVADGRYSGGNHEIALDLRIDCGGCGVISGDVYRRAFDARHYVASFRTAPGMRVGWDQSWTIFAQDEHQRRVEGSLRLDVRPDAANAMTGLIVFAGAMEGLPSRKEIPFVVERTSAAFRSLGLEIEIEENVAPIGGHTAQGRVITIEDALHQAGIETHMTGISDRIPKPANGGWDLSQLHTLMNDLAQAPLTARAWELHLLLLSRSDRRGLLGVMFDSGDALPRQGCAVFAEEIRGIQGIDHERKLIQTAVHELGHALNLAHRFERVVGRADSLSFMNYDWKYRGGQRAPEFWNRFNFTFDPDELEFMRHAPLSPVIPGGAAFHSIAYWSDGNGGYAPYVPEVPLAGWKLEIEAANADTLLQFAQPVFLSVRLTNQSGRTTMVPKFLLDPKAGFIEMMIRRVHAGAAGMTQAQAEAFSPVMQRCFQWDAADDVRLEPGASMQDNINLTFGAGGFAFAEPGTYDVTALLVLFDEASGREFVAKSNTIRLRIATPKSHDEERDAMDFFSPDVGLYLALGGSPVLTKARDSLQEIVERRKHNMQDALVAHATRAMAIDRSRSYVRYADRRFTYEAPKLDEAGDMLEQLLRSKAALDPATLRKTEDLAEYCRTGTRLDSGPYIT